jgi:nicotinamide mononucleotide transporter
MLWVEIAASGLGIASVALLARQSLWCWPTGIAMVSLYFVIFGEARLYSQMALQVVYVVLQAYGWWHWVRGGSGGAPLGVGRVGVPESAAWLAAIALATGALGHSMQRLTDAALPYWDACVTAMSLVAQYLQARKVLECWLLWIAVDVVAIGIYAAQSLYPTLALYAVLLALSVVGYRAWARARPAQAATRRGTLRA